MENTKVLFVIDKNGFGGVQTIAKELLDINIPNVSLYFLYLRNIEDKEVKSTKNVFYSKSKFKYNFSSLFDLVRIIRKEKINILHLNGDKSLILGIIAKKLFPKIKIIHHEHGPLLKESRFYNGLLKLVKSNVDFFIAVSEYAKYKLISEIDISSSKIILIPNFINPNKFKETNNTTEAVFFKTVKNIGYVGRLVEEKGCEYLLKALPLLKFKYHSVIIGDGILRESLIKLSMNLGISMDVDFVGYQEVPEYKTLDVLIVPSLRESFGISVIEAQASGVPVIAADVGGLRELIKEEETGLLFESKDVDDLAAQIEKLFSSTKLYERIKKLAVRQSHQFSLEKFVEKIRELYLSLQNI